MFLVLLRIVRVPVCMFLHVYWPVFVPVKKNVQECCVTKYFRKLFFPCFVGSEGWVVVLWCVVERTLLGRSRICVQGALGQASAQARLHRRRLDACRLECPLSSTGGGVLLHAESFESQHRY